MSDCLFCTFQPHPDHYQWTALHIAADKMHPGTCEMLVAAGGAVVDAEDSLYGSTPLHLAAGNGHTSTVQCLLRRGASKTAKDNEGKTPKGNAKRNGNHALTDGLLS